MDNQQQGEQGLSQEELQGLVPDLVSPKGGKIMNNMVSKANNAKPKIDSMLKLITAQAGLDPVNDFESRVKNPDTITKKVALHRKSGKDGYRVNDVNDLYGARIIADTPNQKKRVLDAIKDLGSNNQIKIDKEEHVDHGTYHAHHIDFNKDGVKGELQIHDPHSLFESVINHEIRAKYGEQPPTQLEAQKAVNQQIGYQLPANQVQRMAQIIQAGRVLKASKQDLYAKPVITKDDVNTFAQFGKLVETGRDRRNMGTLGQTIQSVATNLFGNKAANWTNEQVKNALDNYVKKNYK